LPSRSSYTGKALAPRLSAGDRTASNFRFDPPAQRDTRAVVSVARRRRAAGQPARWADVMERRLVDKPVTPRVRADPEPGGPRRPPGDRRRDIRESRERSRWGAIVNLLEVEARIPRCPRSARSGPRGP
jgi:hypothetical protein